MLRFLSPDLFFNRHYVYTFASTNDIANDDAFGCGKKSVILADIHVQTRQQACAALPYDDMSGEDMLACEHLDAQAL